MKQKQLSASHTTVKNKFKHTSKSKAFSEYLWNSIDAGSTSIQIDVDRDEEIDQIKSIVVTDDGHGITVENNNSPFDFFEKSKKKGSPDKLMRGKYGRGRLSFFKFCDSASWVTKSKGSKPVELRITEGTLDKFFIKELSDDPIDSCSGTRVTFNSFNEPAKSFIEQITGYIKEHVTWINYFRPDISICINGERVALKSSIKCSNSDAVINEDDVNYELYQWKTKIDVEECGIYYCDEYRNVIHKENVKPKNSFFYSCIVVSPWFNQFSYKNDTLTQKFDKTNQKFLSISGLAKEKINSEYLSLRKSAIDELIDEYTRCGIIPKSIPNNALANFKTQQLKDAIRVIYNADSAVFDSLSTQKQKKILVKLIDQIVNSDNPQALFEVLDGVISLNETEMKMLSNSLEKVTMGNIVRTINQLENRLYALDLFENLLANKKEAYEVAHIQSVIESNMWIFGEEYHVVTTEEEKFEKALRELLKFKEEDLEAEDDEDNEVYAPKHYDKYKIKHENKNKEMDVFATQKSPMFEQGKRYYRNLVVELKRPSVKLTDKEFDQIVGYSKVIQSEEKFDTRNDQWDFVLVGNKITESEHRRAMIDMLLKDRQEYGKQGLLIDSGNVRVWIKEWSEIINDYKLRYSHIINSLNSKYSGSVEETNPDKLTHEIRSLATTV